MNDLQERIDVARNAGYSDEEIYKVLKASSNVKHNPEDKRNWTEKVASLPEVFGKGLKSSSLGILVGQGPTFDEMRDDAVGDYNWLQRTVMGGGQVIGDLPAMVGAGTIGSLAGSPVVGATAAFGITGAIREGWNQYQEFKHDNPNSDFTFADFIDKAPEIAKETGKEALIGFVTGGASKYLKATLPRTSKVFGVKTLDNLGKEFSALTGIGKATVATGELATMTTSSSLIKKGELPSTQDFIDNAILLTGMKLTEHLAGKILSYAKKNNIDPDKIVEAANEDGLSTEELNQAIPEDTLRVIEEVEKVREPQRHEAAEKGDDVAEAALISKKAIAAKEIKEELTKDVAKIDKERKTEAREDIHEAKKTGEELQKNYDKAVDKSEFSEDKLLNEQVEKAKDIEEKRSFEHEKKESRLVKDYAKLDKILEKDIVEQKKESAKKFAIQENNALGKLSRDREKKLELIDGKLSDSRTEEFRKKLVEKRNSVINDYQEKVKYVLRNEPLKTRFEKSSLKLDNDIEKLKIASEKMKIALKEKTKKDIDVLYNKKLADLNRATTLKSRAVGRELVSIQKSIEGKAQKLSAKYATNMKKRDVTYKTKIQKAKKAAVKKFVSSKEKIQAGYTAIGKSDKGILTIKNKPSASQDYKMTRNGAEVNRLADSNSLTVLEHSNELSDIDSGFKTAEQETAWYGKVAKMFKGFGSKMFVDLPFESIGDKETGFHVKNMFSIKEKVKGEALSLRRKMRDAVKNGDDMAVILASELDNASFAKLPQDIQDRASKGRNLLRDFTDKYGKQLEDLGAFKHQFPKSRITYNREQIELTRQDLLKDIPKGEIAKLSKKLKDLVAENKILESVKFTHIPTAMWWESEYSKNPSMANKALRLLSNKQRKNLTINDLVQTGKVDTKLVTLDNILVSYASKVANDISVLNIANSAVMSGLAIKKGSPKTGYKSGYVPLSSIRSPVLAGYEAHPVFAEWLHNYTSDYNHGFISRMLGMTKGLAFYNPFILPVYDFYQSIQLGGIGPTSKLAKAFKGMKSYSLEYQRALENNLSSSPFDITFDDFKANLAVASKNPLVEFIRDFATKGNLKTFGLKAIYNFSSRIAWNLDRTMRFASYLHLESKGFSPRDAAQTAARFHGDYASVKPQLRRTLNNFFFTPTFKLIMGRVQYDMVKNAGKLALGKLPEDPAQRAVAKVMAKGLFNTAAIMIGTDMFMQWFGFDRQQFGRKYYKEVDDDGKKKELVVTLSNPTTTVTKFAYRGKEALDPLNGNALDSFVKTFSWELHPVWRVANEIISNKNYENEPIFSAISDSSVEKLAKSTKYALKRIVAISQLFSEEGKMTAESRKALFKDLDTLPAMLINTFGFNYLRNTKDSRDAYRIKKIITDFKSDAKNGRLTKKQIEVGARKIDYIVKNYNAEKK